ncbi:MAG TPA: radical SAM protein [Bdellovibrionota bacterium]|nr:radical SAM protein [Bdellovibrionota bacterium]
MKVANQLKVPLFKEGLNALKVYPGYKLGQVWSRPVSVNFLITSRCNSKCITCDSWKLTDHDRELTLDDFKRLAAEIAELDIPIVTIGGGEPTLRSDLWEIIRAFKEQGRVVQLTTNALTMKAEQRKQVYDSGLDRVTISVDSHLPRLYHLIRGVDGGQKVLENLQALLRERPPTLEVDSNTVLCKDNAESFLETLDYLISIGVPKVNFSAVTTAGNNYLMVEPKKDLADIPSTLIDRIIVGLLERKKTSDTIPASTTFIKGLRTYYANPTKVVFPCFAGHLTLDIFQDGSVHGCGNLPAFSNVREASLREIWCGDAASQNRTDMAEGRCTNCYLSCKIELAIAANPRHLPSFALEKLAGSF